MRAELYGITEQENQSTRVREYRFLFTNEKRVFFFALVEEGGTNWKRWYDVICGYNSCRKDGRRMVLDRLDLIKYAGGWTVEPTSTFDIIVIEPDMPPFVPATSAPEERHRKDLHE